MIGSLRGALVWRDTDEVGIEVGGIGYRVVVMPTTSVSLGEVGDEVFVHVHHHVREDTEVLYGFGSLPERRTFEALIATHGVGPSLAMAILGVHPPAALARVLATEDLAALCLVPGVGKKTGARLLVELRSSLEDELAGLDGTAAATTGAPADPGGGEGGGHARSDVRDALVQLGYGPDEVAAVLRDLPDGEDSGALLRTALQRLAVA